MSKIEVILISQFPLPYKKIASWTNMYNYLLSNTDHNFNYIICPKVEERAKNASYQFLRDVSITDKIKNKLIDANSRYGNYIEALDNIIDSSRKYIIHIVDNSGIVVPIDTHLKEKYNRNNFYIQYYYQGFAPLFKERRKQAFLYAIDELFFLTNLSYKAYINYYVDCTFRARVVYNATDSNKFKLVSNSEKFQLKKDYGIDDTTTVFMWCSQDRPKKGLHIVLEAFQKVHQKNKNTQLLVVGIDREINQDGVKVVGRVPNDQLPRYYQMADVYLFPSLWKEGFGIVLAEALKCGCYCIASSQGGIPEVLNYGKFGVLIENPNFIEDWVSEMENAIQILKEQGKNPFLDKLPNKIYDVDQWANTINEALKDAKQVLKLNSGV